MAHIPLEVKLANIGKISGLLTTPNREPHLCAYVFQLNQLNYYPRDFFKPFFLSRDTAMVDISPREKYMYVPI